MAVSKNNRKKSKKRAQPHMSTVKRNERQGVQEQQPKSSGGDVQWLSMVSLILMVMGFIVAMFSEYGIVGYPVTFIGSLLGLSQTKWTTRRNKVTFVSYIIYCILVLYMWIQILIGQA